MFKSYSFIEQTKPKKLVLLSDERMKEIKSNDSDVSSPKKEKPKTSYQIQSRWSFNFNFSKPLLSVPILIATASISILLLFYNTYYYTNEKTLKCDTMFDVLNAQCWLSQTFNVWNNSKKKAGSKMESKIQFHHWIQFVCTKIFGIWGWHSVSSVIIFSPSGYAKAFNILASKK